MVCLEVLCWCVCLSETRRNARAGFKDRGWVHVRVREPQKAVDVAKQRCKELDPVFWRGFDWLLVGDLTGFWGM